MDFIIDNKETEEKYQSILKAIKLKKNGDVSDMMTQQGINYKLNWGVAVFELREMAKLYEADHLLALKLWNKKWRETMILATLLDRPKEVSEEQMDFWTKSFENTEIAEQASTNLWVKSKFAFAKAQEWCRGKKHVVRFTGIHLMGRLAIADKQAIDEMFEPFLEELPTLAKDDKLFTPLYRTIIALAKRSKNLHLSCLRLASSLQLNNSEIANQLGEQLYDELNSDYFREMVDKKFS